MCGLMKGPGFLYDMMVRTAANQLSVVTVATGGWMAVIVGSACWYGEEYGKRSGRKITLTEFTVYLFTKAMSLAAIFKE